LLTNVVLDFERENIEVSAMGVPQGSVISPLITNFTLDGLEERVTTRQQTAMTNLKRTKWIKGKGIVYERMQFREDVKGTILHLQIIYAFLDFFMVTNSIRLNGIIIVCGAYDLFWN
jgi:hypothetical protein